MTPRDQIELPVVLVSEHDADIVLTVICIDEPRAAVVKRTVRLLTYTDGEINSSRDIFYRT